MERERGRTVFGLIAIVAGMLLLLQNFRVFGALTDLIWAGFLAAIGVLFLGIFGNNRQQWWALIPGIIMLGLSLTVLSSMLLPGMAATLPGAIFLGSVGLAFVAVYVARPTFWWAVIPAGTMLTLAGIVLFEGWLSPLGTPALLFIGLGLTFALLSLLPVEGKQMRWPLIPAGALILFGLFFVIGQPALANLIWPLALIGAGIYVMFNRRGSGSPPVSHPR